MVELFNRAPTRLTFPDGVFSKGISFIFPASKVIAPGAFLVACEGLPVAMQALYPAINVIWNSSGNLAMARIVGADDPAGNPRTRWNISMVTIGPNTLMPVDPASNFAIRSQINPQRRPGLRLLKQPNRLDM